MLKNLVKDLKPSSTLAINETSKQLEKQGKKIFKFGFGQSPFKVPEDVVEELKSNAYQNKYLPMQGLEELREAVAKYSSKEKNYNYKASNVIIGPGSLLFRSVFAAKTSTFIFFSSSSKFFNSTIVSPSLRERAG